MAIISLVLAGAYRLSTASAASLQNAKEHQQALQLAQSQVELVRGSDTATQTAIYAHSASTPFCMVGGSAPTAKDLTGALPASATSDSFGEYPSQCVQGFYHLSVVYDSAQSDLFTIRVRWDGTTGTRQQVSLLYRIHPATP